jgi:hypothetical protein
MCELLKSEPIEEEIPIEREDLNIDTQLAMSVYDKLQANWEGMSGQYLGKDLSLIPVLLEHYKFDKPLQGYIWEIIPIIDNIVAKDISEKSKRRSKQRDTTPKGM